LSIGSTTTLFDATVTDALNYDLLVGTDVLARLNAKVDVGRGLLEIQADPDHTQVLQLKHDLLGDPAIALCAFEVHEAEEPTLTGLDQLWTRFYDVVYSLPPKEPDVMGWHRQISDRWNQHKSCESEAWIDQRLLDMETLGDQILQHYEPHPPDQGVQALMGYMSSEAFQHILAGYTLEDRPSPNPLIPTTAPEWWPGHEGYEYLNNDDIFMAESNLDYYTKDNDRDSAEAMFNPPAQTPTVMCTFQVFPTPENSPFDLDFGKLWWLYVQAVLSMPPEHTNAKGWRRTVTYDDIWDWDDVCCLYTWANKHDDAVHVLKHKLLQQYEENLTAMGAIKLMDELETRAYNYIYSGYSQTDVVNEHPEYLLASALLQISAPESDQVAYREAIEYLQRHASGDREHQSSPARGDHVSCCSEWQHSPSSSYSGHPTSADG